MAKKIRYLLWAAAFFALAFGVWKVESNVSANMERRRHAAAESVSAVRFSLNDRAGTGYLNWPEDVRAGLKPAPAARNAGVLDER